MKVKQLLDAKTKRYFQLTLYHFSTNFIHRMKILYDKNICTKNVILKAHNERCDGYDGGK